MNELMTKQQKAVKDIFQVLADNDLTAWECSMVLLQVEELFNDRPLSKAYAYEIEANESFDRIRGL